MSESYISSGYESKYSHIQIGNLSVMSNVFKGPIQTLPEADIPIDGIRAYLSQAKTHQIIFMEFEKDVDLPEHAHEAQVGIVLEGLIELTVGGKTQRYEKGDRYYIPKGVRHSGKIFAGYADITFFDEPNRYTEKKSLVP